ncbi:trypsin-like serine peptidase [Brevundimonas sp.]|uniref:trypsin-like serine peptidase n=1 Tax=Brevundimonas sp. TaxID=1871086 RepID=UPI003D102AE9
MTEGEEIDRQRLVSVARRFLSREERASLPAGLDALGPGAAPGGLEALEALEALVRLGDRPAVPVRGGVPDYEQAAAEGWKGLKIFDGPIRKLTASTGRIELRGGHVGTGFVVGPGLILTNRHVLELIGKCYRTSTGSTWILSAGEPVIAFGRELDGLKGAVFRVTGVAVAGKDPIGGTMSLTKTDAALLEVEAVSEDGTLLPPALAIASQPGEALRTAGKIVVCGYPGPPDLPPRGSLPDAQRAELIAVMHRIFALRFGVKRLSLGVVTEAPGAVVDAGEWVFAHDATTLGGASGAPVAFLDGDNPLVVGLHFGGETLERNFALGTPALFQPPFASHFNMG